MTKTSYMQARVNGGTIIYEPPPYQYELKPMPHQCDPPNAIFRHDHQWFPERGTIWKCDCGKSYEYRHGKWKRLHWWNRRPKPNVQKYPSKYGR